MSDDASWSEASLLRELEELLPAFALGKFINTAHFLHAIREQLRARGTAFVTQYQARQWVMDVGRWTKNGCKCPTCDQNAKVWTRTLTNAMGRALVKIVRWFLRDKRLVFARELKLGGGDYAKMRHWGFLFFEVEYDDDRRPRGGMTPFPKGIDFAQRRVSVPREALVYNGQVLRFQGDLISIDQLPNFDYESIWGTGEDGDES